MAKQNTSLMLASYTTDFNTSFTNIPVKFSAEAPIPTGIYANRTTNCGGARLPFSPRYLQAEFPTGTYKYVVSATTAILTLRTALITAGATCVNLIGEKWSTVPESQLNTPLPAYKTTPYTAASIPGTGDRETGRFSYASDVLGTVTLGYAVESTNAPLLAAAKAGLDTPVVGGRGSRPRNQIVTPRAFNIIAEVDDDTSVNRLSPSSVLGDIADHADLIIPAAYFISYQGESIKGVENI